MDFNRTAMTIGESVTLKLNAKAAAIRSEGGAVIHLGGGEPKSKAPSDAVAKAMEVLKTGEIRYAPAEGIPALRKAVVKYTKDLYGREVETCNVMVANGAKGAMTCCLRAILNPGEEVIFPAPYWVSYPEMVKLCGGVPVPVYADDGTVYPSVRDVANVAGSKTKAVIINSPNNPSGAMYSAEFIRDIVGLCEDRGLYLIMDDIYHRLIFDGRQAVSVFAYAKVAAEDSKLVVVNGVSKQYAMTGFRIGWSVANRELTRIMTNIQSHESSGPSVVSQWAAVGALNGPQSSVEELRTTLESNRDALMDRLESLGGVKVRKPDGTFYCFCDFSSYEKDSTKLSAFLLDKALVVTVPGVEFGMEGYLRLSFCGSVEDITEGVERIKWALDPSSPKELRIGDRIVLRDWT
jgi:aspartate aminotransferase